MNGIVRPRGRAPAGIYWRRRLVLVAVVLLAAAGVMKLVGGGDEPDASASSASTDKDDASHTSDDGGESGGDRKRERKSRADRDDPDVRSGADNVRVRMGSAKPCDPGQVSVSPSVLPGTYAGDAVPLRLGFATGGDEPCVLSLTDHTPLVSVSADGTTVWSSEKCSDLFDAQRLRVEPDWTTYLDAHWSGRVSGNNCGDNADFAEPGDYTVQAALLGGEPAKASVTLEKEPEQDPETDKGDDKNGDDKNDDGEDEKSDESTDGDDSGRNDARSDGDDGSDSDRGDRSGVDERDGGQRDR